MVSAILRSKTQMLVIICLILLGTRESSSSSVEKYGLFMPNVRPNKPDLYICTPVRITPNQTFYIVAFEPKASVEVAHHIIVYGCMEPGSSKPAWNCGEMATANQLDANRSPCSDTTTVIYAWARNAPMLELPNGVAFKIGHDSAIAYLVLQVHYSSVDAFKDGHLDSSGIYLHYTRKPISKLAGVLLLGTEGTIPAMSTESMETACSVEEDKVLHPFAFRVHTHSLGIIVSGYKVERIRKKDYWTLIGRRNPLEPEMFYPVRHNMTIKYGDTVAASCKMFNNRQYETIIGRTSSDEMCNFYLMYWVENSSPLAMKYCFTMGPPYYQWENYFNNIPLVEQIIP